MRQNFTKKEMVNLLNNRVKRGELSNVSIILNGFENKAKYGAGYGYGYGYGYGAYSNGYHEEDEPKNIFLKYYNRFFKKNNKLMSEKILITGGAGFIGSNLCEYFLSKGYFVTCLDNFATGHRKNIEALLVNEKFTLIEGDIRNLADCKKAVEGADYVLHQAALGSVPRSINDPITTNDVNVSGFLNMLVASRDAKVKRFVYAASSSTYGDSESLPKVEDVIGKPLSPYAITKYVNELYADNFSKTIRY